MVKTKAPKKGAKKAKAPAKKGGKSIMEYPR